MRSKNSIPIKNEDPDMVSKTYRKNLSGYFMISLSKGTHKIFSTVCSNKKKCGKKIDFNSKFVEKNFSLYCSEECLKEHLAQEKKEKEAKDDVLKKKIQVNDVGDFSMATFIEKENLEDFFKKIENNIYKKYSAKRKVKGVKVLEELDSETFFRILRIVFSFFIRKFDEHAKNFDVLHHLPQIKVLFLAYIERELKPLLLSEEVKDGVSFERIVKSLIFAVAHLFMLLNFTIVAKRERDRIQKEKEEEKAKKEEHNSNEEKKMEEEIRKKFQKQKEDSLKAFNELMKEESTKKKNNKTKKNGKNKKKKGKKKRKN